MISRQDLERLAHLKSDQGILTAYIPLDPRLRFVRRQPASPKKGILRIASSTKPSSLARRPKSCARTKLAIVYLPKAEWAVY